MKQKLIRYTAIFSKAAIALYFMFGGFITPSFSQAVNVPSEYLDCIPVIEKFTVSPLNLTNRDQGITSSIRVTTSKCIIRGDVGDGSKWNIHLVYLDGGGNYLSYLPLPEKGYIRGSDFKRVSNDESKADYNKYYADYKLYVTQNFVSINSNTFSLRADINWNNDTFTENKNPSYKITAPAIGSTPPKATQPPTNTNKPPAANPPAGTSPPSVNRPAQTNGPTAGSNGGFVPCGNTVSDPCTIGHLFKGFVVIVNYLVVMAGFVAVAAIIYAGLKMVASQGDDGGGLKDAKGRLSGAVIGLVIVAVAYVLINALFSGSLSIGVCNGGTILTDPKAYIQETGNCE